MKKHTLFNQCTALLLAASLLLSLASCGNQARATTMHLKHTEGAVAVSDDAGQDVPLLEGLGLYSGYGVNTRSASFAWINLDDVKLTKMDQESEIAIQKEDKLLEIEVKSGSMFFNITQPLEDDETMNIRTSTMLVGIRGTCGWVAQNTAALLEGTVSVTADDQTVTVNAGEMAVLTDGILEVKPFTASDVPAFVQEEIADDEDLAADIQETAGMDLTGADPMAEYADFLAQIEKRGKILYAEIIDMEQDGNPELFVIHENGLNEATDTNFIALTFCRKESEGISLLWRGDRPWNKEEWELSTLSLAECGGRLYLERHGQGGKYDHHWESWEYMFSIAEKDGTEESWHRMYVNYVVSSNNSINGIKYYGYGNTEGDEAGHNEISAEECEAIHGQFNEVRTLVYLYTPDGKDVTVTSNQSEIEEIFQSAEPAETVTG